MDEPIGNTPGGINQGGNSILEAQNSNVLEAPSVGSFLNKMDVQRGNQKGKLKFGEPVIPFGMTENPNFAHLLNPEQQPVAVHNLPGRYFAAMPIITGGDTSQFPVGVWAMRHEQKPGYSPTEKQLENVLKELQEPEAYSAFNQKSSQIFKNHVLGKFNDMQNNYGVDTYRILNGQFKNKAELRDFNDFHNAVQASKNVANMSKTFGAWTEQVNKDQAEGKYVDPETTKSMMKFTKELPYAMSADPEDFHKWMNDNLSGIQAKMNVYKAIDGAMTGTPLMSWITQAKADGKDISGAFSEIQKTDSKFMPKKQLDDLASALIHDYGYTFGGKNEQEATEEMKKRILNRFIPETKTSLHFAPGESGSNYEVAPIKKAINVNLPAKQQAGKAQQYITGEVNAKSWELKANIPIQKEYNKFFDPENWQQATPVGAKEFTISSVVELPVHKSGPYKGKPASQDIVDKFPNQFEMKKFASGTVRSDVPVTDTETGQPIIEPSTGQPKVKSEITPRYIDYDVVKPTLEERKIKLLEASTGSASTSTGSAQTSAGSVTTEKKDDPLGIR